MEKDSDKYYREKTVWILKRSNEIWAAMCRSSGVDKKFSPSVIETGRALEFLTKQIARLEWVIKKGQE